MLCTTTAALLAGVFGYTVDGLALGGWSSGVQVQEKTLRTRFTERCCAGWIRDQVGKKRLTCDSQRLSAHQPNDCSTTVLEEATGRRCADRVSWHATNVSWYGGFGSTPRLQLLSCDAEFVNLHRRILSRGRFGSIRATVALRGSDVDASHWLKSALSNVLRRVLEEDTVDFKTTVEGDRVHLRGATTSGLRFTVSFRLDAEGGALALREPQVWVEERQSSNFVSFKDLPLPTSLLENLGSFYLSTVVVDFAEAFVVTDVTATGDALKISVVSSSATQRAAQRFAQRKAADYNKLGGEVPAASPAWGLQPATSLFGLESLLRRNNPLRHTYFLGEGLPWILNPSQKAPAAVQIAMAGIGVSLRLASLPYDVYRALRVTKAYIAYLVMRVSLGFQEANKLNDPCITTL